MTLKLEKHHQNAFAIAQFFDTIKDLQLNLERSPWSRERKIYDWVMGAADELEEVRIEIEVNKLNNPFSQKESGKAVGEELGDVLMNVLCAILVNAEQGGPALYEVLAGISKKIRERKPWIFDGSEIVWNAGEEHAEFLKNKERLKAERDGLIEGPCPRCLGDEMRAHNITCKKRT